MIPLPTRLFSHFSIQERIVFAQHGEENKIEGHVHKHFPDRVSGEVDIGE
jgi:hypothetical protein